MRDTPPVPAILSRRPGDAGIATLEIRGHRVVLDRDLARLFGVETRRLNEQLRRNLSRFDGYAFQLDAAEVTGLMSQLRHQVRGGAARASALGPSPSMGW